MIVGFPPFYTGSNNDAQMYSLIIKKPVFFPDAQKHGIEMSAQCMNFISQCLEKDPKKRLGSNGLDEIINHPWFDDIDKAQLLKRQIPPPFKPKLSRDKLDTTNFEDELIRQEAEISEMPREGLKKVEK